MLRSDLPDMSLTMGRNSLRFVTRLSEMPWKPEFLTERLAVNFRKPRLGFDRDIPFKMIRGQFVENI